MPHSESGSSRETPAAGVSRRKLALSLVIAVLLIVGGLAARIFFIPVERSAAWSVTIESESGLAPAEIYCGDERLGMTPVTLQFDRSDSRFERVERSPNAFSAQELLDALHLDLRHGVSPTKLAPGSVTRSGSPGLVGQVVLIPSPTKVLADWANAVVRRPDGTLDRGFPVIVRDGDSEVGFFLRARRGTMSVLAASFSRTRPPEGIGSAVREFLLRREYREGTLVIEIGPPLDRATIEEQLGGGEWYLDSVPVGTERLETPRVERAKEGTR